MTMLRAGTRTGSGAGVSPAGPIRRPVRRSKLRRSMIRAVGPSQMAVGIGADTGAAGVRADDLHAKRLPPEKHDAGLPCIR